MNRLLVWRVSLLVVAIVLILLDQWTKSLALSHLGGQPPVSVIPHLNFVLVFNRGAAFGFLAEAGGWQNTIFILIAAGVGLYLIILILRSQGNERWFDVAICLILGGAAGNLYDRLTRGYVVDFIDVYYQNWHWPAFNIADSAIFIGAVLLVLNLFIPGSPTSTSKAKEKHPS